MDRALLLNILGKKDSVDLGDMIFNLRGISESLRDMINLGLTIPDDFILENKNNLNNIYNVIFSIDENLKNSNNISGYSNSKKYLSNFISNLRSNIAGLMNSMEPLDIKNMIHYNNTLMDLILIY